jgi:hypothetical protein
MSPEEKELRLLFEKEIIELFVELHQTGKNIHILRDKFRTAGDSYQQRFVYALLTDELVGVARYVDSKDLFAISNKRLNSQIKSCDASLKRINNFSNYVPSQIDFSRKGKFGYVYILENKCLPNMIKIGFTSGTVFERAKQLSNTSVPTPFEVKYLARVRNPKSVEQAVHSALAKYRVSDNREFFNVTVGDAVAKIEETATYIRFQKSSLFFE